MFFDVVSKNNYYDSQWGFLLFKTNEKYEAKLVISDSKDYFVIFSYEINKDVILSFKLFAENFKIIKVIT